MLERAAAQALVDGLSAVALAAWAPALARSRRTSPMQARLGFAFATLGLFFTTRAASEALDSARLTTAVLLIVCVLPLSALLLAEGALRRHAPSALKVFIAVGGAAVAIALLAGGGRPPVSNWGLGGYVIASMFGVVTLLLTRDRARLSSQENSSANTLFAAGLLLTVLSVSDFLPAAPVGLSGIGAALLAFILALGSTSGLRRLWAEVLAAVLAATVVAAALVAPLNLQGTAEPMRLAAILLALMLAIGTIVATSRRVHPPAAGTLADALARADISSLDGFLAELADQPLLNGLRLAQGAVLADYDAPSLGAMMAALPVWTRPHLETTSEQGPSRAGDELRDLMARTEATHAMLITASPLRIALLTLAGVGAAPEAQAHLAIFAKLASVAVAASHDP